MYPAPEDPVMRWSKPIGGLAGAVVVLWAVGAAVTLGIEPLSLGAVEPFAHRRAAGATVVLVIVFVLAAVVVGARSGRRLSNPYW